MTDEVAEAAREEMDYETVETRAGNEMAVSVPCQLRFADEPRQHTERFHDALDARGYSAVDHNPAKRHDGDGGPHYDGEIMAREHYHRVRVLVFRNDVVRLYPHDEYVPTVEELAAIIEALAEGFDAGLYHAPIETDE